MTTKEKKTKGLPLTIGILSTDPNSGSTKTFVQEIERQGHFAQVIDPNDCILRLREGDGRDDLFIRGGADDKARKLKATDFDAVIVRIAGSKAKFGMAVLRHFQALNIFTTLQDYSVLVSGDKWHCAQVASRVRVDVPRQVFTVNPQNHEELMNWVDKKPPIFAKMQRGSLGMGCFVLPDAVHGKMFLESMRAAHQPIILQRHLNKHVKGQKEDVRIWCVGGETAKPQFAAMRRISMGKDPRTNWSIHKTAEPHEPSQMEKDICVKIAKAIGAGVSAIDLMWDEDTMRWIFIEANSNPGTGICDIATVNPVQLSVSYVVENCARSDKPNQAFWDNISVSANNEFPQPNFLNNPFAVKKFPYLANLLKK
jgi:ribosomal protein S6--L-glutamate ligase